MKTYEDFLKHKQTAIVNSGFEIKESYFNEAIKNCKQAEQDKSQKQLFEAV